MSATGEPLFAVGAFRARAADAVFQLVAYHLTGPDVASDVARTVMLRVPGPDLVFLLPDLAALAVGIVVLTIAAVRSGLVPA